MLHKLLNFTVKGGVAYLSHLYLHFAPLYVYETAEDTKFMFGA